MTFRACLSLGCLVVFASLTHASSVFNFNTDPAGEMTPFTDTVDGLSATFGGEAAVCPSEGLFSSLSGNVLIQDLCLGGEVGPLSISFSSDVESAFFDFATAGGPAPVTLLAFENNTPVGTANFTSAVPPGFFNGEGVASFTGKFNLLVLGSSDILAIDNVSANTVPEPATFGTVLSAAALFVLIHRRRNLSRKPKLHQG